MGSCISWINVPLIYHKHICFTEGKPLTSPSTNLVMDPVRIVLAENVLARGKVLEFKAATMHEWEAAQREWEEKGAGRG